MCVHFVAIVDAVAITIWVVGVGTCGGFIDIAETVVVAIDIDGEGEAVAVATAVIIIECNLNSEDTIACVGVSEVDGFAALVDG